MPNAAAIVPGCRATEEVRAAGDPRMAVEVSDLTGTSAAATANLQALVQGEKLLRLVPNNGDVRAYAVPAGGPDTRNDAVPTLGVLTVPTWVAVARDGQIIGTPVAMSDPGAVNKLVANLATVSRFRNLAALTNPAPDNPLKDMVKLDLLRKGPDGKWVVAAPEPDGRVAFVDGDAFGLRFTNLTNAGLFVTALDFGLSYGITQLYPLPESQPTLQPGPFDYPPPTDTPIELFIPDTFKADEGLETIKLLVTSEPADFRWFQQVGVRGKDRGGDSTLEEVLEWASRGETRDARPPKVTKTTNWTTVERSFVLRRKKQA